MDKDYLRARLASIQTEFESQVNYLESDVVGTFEEQSIEALRETWKNVKRRVEGFDRLITLIRETQEWLKND